jgi:hypothetical protein
MHPAVRSGQSGDCGIGEHERTIARNDVAAEQELADEQSIGVRAIVVGAVDFVPMTVVSRENERLAAHVRAPIHRRHPIRRIIPDHQELGPRRRIAWYLVGATRATARGNQDDRRKSVANRKAGESVHRAERIYRQPAGRSVISFPGPYRQSK